MRRTVIFILIALAATACTRVTSDREAGDETLIPAPSGTVATSTTTTTAPTSTSTTTRPSATSSTTTTTSATPTTRAPATATTVAIPKDNLPPTVEILAPAPLSAHIAGYDVDRKDFGAYVTLSARASDPNGDTVQVRWSAPGWGSFGTGTSIVAWISTRGADASQPIITATATDQWGVATSTSAQIIVWIPSDF